MINLAERIRQIMSERNIKTIDLAERCGMSQPNLSLNLKSNNMTLNVAERIAKGLGMEVVELLATKEEIEAERNRRIRLRDAIYMDSVCPCCGEKICVMMNISKS